MCRLVLFLLAAAAAAASASTPAQPLQEAAAEAPAPSPGLLVLRGASGAVPAPDGAVRAPDSSAWSALFRATGSAPGPEPGTVRLTGQWVRPDAIPGPATPYSPAAVWAARLEAAAAAQGGADDAGPGGFDAPPAGGAGAEDARPGEVQPAAGRVWQVAGYYLPPGCLSATVCGQPYGYGGNPYGGWGYGGNVGVWG